MSNTDDRAEFEAWGSGHNFDFTHAGFGLYAKTETQAAWMAWKEQAARRAPVVPHGWKLVPEWPTVQMSVAGDDVYREYGSDVFSSNTIYTRMLATAPQPPEGNLMSEILTSKTVAEPVQMPEPTAYLYHDAPTLDDLIANESAGIPLNSVCISVKRMPQCRNETPLYTEQQVRQLLAEKESK